MTTKFNRWIRNKAAKVCECDCTGYHYRWWTSYLFVHYTNCVACTVHAKDLFQPTLTYLTQPDYIRVRVMLRVCMTCICATLCVTIGGRRSGTKRMQGRKLRVLSSKSIVCILPRCRCRSQSRCFDVRHSKLSCNIPFLCIHQHTEITWSIRSVGYQRERYFVHIVTATLHLSNTRACMLRLRTYAHWA